VLNWLSIVRILFFTTFIMYTLKSLCSNRSSGTHDLALKLKCRHCEHIPRKRHAITSIWQAGIKFLLNRHRDEITSNICSGIYKRLRLSLLYNWQIERKFIPGTIIKKKGINIALRLDKELCKLMNCSVPTPADNTMRCVSVCLHCHVDLGTVAVWCTRFTPLNTTFVHKVSRLI
jgi:hypothetical protein